MDTQLSEQKQNKGMRLAMIGQASGPVMQQLLMFSAFGVLFIKYLGGTDLQAMMLGSLIMLGRILQIPTSLLIPPSKGKKYMLICWAVNAFITLGVVGITFIPFNGPSRVNLIISLLVFGQMISLSGSTFWWPLLHDVIPEEKRGRFFGKMRTLITASRFTALILIGFFLGKEPPLWKFRLVISIGACMLLLRNISIARIPEGYSLKSGQNHSDWRLYLSHIFKRKQTLVFFCYYSLLAFCAGFAGRPLVLYLNSIGISTRDNIFVFMTGNIGGVVALLISGAIIDRVGTKKVFLTVHIILFCFCILIASIAQMEPAAIMFLLPMILIGMGMINSAGGVASTVQLFHLAPFKGRAFFMSLAMILITGGRALSPIIAGFFLDRAGNNAIISLFGISLNTFQVMLISAGVMMLTLIILLLFVEDVKNDRKTKTGSEEK